MIQKGLPTGGIVEFERVQVTLNTPVLHLWQRRRTFDGEASIHIVRLVQGAPANHLISENGHQRYVDLIFVFGRNSLLEPPPPGNHSILNGCVQIPSGFYLILLKIKTE